MRRMESYPVDNKLIPAMIKLLDGETSSYTELEIFSGGFQGNVSIEGAEIYGNGNSFGITYRADTLALRKVKEMYISLSPDFVDELIEDGYDYTMEYEVKATYKSDSISVFGRDYPKSGQDLLLKIIEG